MQKDWEANGQLAEIRSFQIPGPAEIITVSPEEYALIESLREKIIAAKGVALFGLKLSTKPLNHLMFSMEDAESIVTRARQLCPNCSVLNAMDVLHSKDSSSSLRWKGRLDFFDEVATALIDGDEEFFRNVATVLQTGLNRGPYERWTIYIHKAYFELLGRVSGIIPTKKEVRELATYKHAVDDRWTLADKAVYKDKHVFIATEGKAIDARKKQLADPDSTKNNKAWTARFQRAGLSELPSNRGGQPTHNKPR